jgi:hypothetical protein
MPARRKIRPSSFRGHKWILRSQSPSSGSNFILSVLSVTSATVTATEPWRMFRSWGRSLAGSGIISPKRNPSIRTRGEGFSTRDIIVGQQNFELSFRCRTSHDLTIAGKTKGHHPVSTSYSNEAGSAFAPPATLRVIPLNTFSVLLVGGPVIPAVALSPSIYI